MLGAHNQVVELEGKKSSENVVMISSQVDHLGVLLFHLLEIFHAVAPHIAAERAGVTIDPQQLAGIEPPSQADVMIVEGVGGWRVPLGNGLMLADLARALSEEVILVVGVRLGCINHALLTADRIVRDGFRLKGWIANLIDPDMPALEENLATLEAQLPVERLGTLAFGDTAGEFLLDLG